MYVINPTTKITNTVVSSEDTAYPKENLSDDFRTSVWKGSASVAQTVTLTVGTGASAIGIAYTNSPTVNVHVNNPSHDTTYTIDSGHPNLFVYYGVASGQHTVTLTFADPTVAGDIPYCGIIRCSNAYEFNNPGYGLQEGLKDYSVKKRFNSGALYYHQGEIVRTFSGNIDVDRDSEFWVFMHTLAKARGQAPMFWQVTDVNNEDWAVFAELNGLPSGSHDYPSDSVIKFNLLEAV